MILFINSVIEPYTIGILDAEYKVLTKAQVEENAKSFRSIAVEFLHRQREQIAACQTVIYVNGPGKFNDVRAGYLLAQSVSAAFPSMQLLCVRSLDLLKQVNPHNCFIKASKSELYTLIDGKITTIDKPDNFQATKFNLARTGTQLSKIDCSFNAEQLIYGKEPNIQAPKSVKAYVMLTMTLVLIMVSVPLALMLSNLNTQSKRLISASMDLENATLIGTPKLKQEASLLQKDGTTQNVNIDVIEIDDRYKLTVQHIEVNDIPQIPTRRADEQNQENEAPSFDEAKTGTPIDFANPDFERNEGDNLIYTMPAHGSGNTLDTCKPMHYYPMEHDCNYWNLTSDESLVMPIYGNPFPLELNIKADLLGNNLPFELMILNENGDTAILEPEDNVNTHKFRLLQQNLLSDGINSFLIVRFNEKYPKLSDNKRTNQLKIQLRSHNPMTYIRNFTFGQIYDIRLSKSFNISQIVHPAIFDGDLGILHQN